MVLIIFFVLYCISRNYLFWIIIYDTFTQLFRLLWFSFGTYLYILKSCSVNRFLASSNLKILTKALPCDRAPECKSRIEAPPVEPPIDSPLFAMLSNAATSDGFTSVSNTTLPHFLGVQPIVKRF